MNRLFGVAGLEDEVRRDLDALVEMPPATLEKVGSWLSESPNPIASSWANVNSFAEYTSLDAHLANRVLVLLRYLIGNWRTFGLSSEDIRTALQSLKYPKDKVNNVVRLFEKLEPSKERIYRQSLKRTFETTALPTIDDVNLIWDLRPVFEDFAYDPEAQGQGYESLLTHTYLLMFEISASRADGEKESATFQLSEDDFERILNGLHKAKKQLDVIKKTLVV